MPWLPKSTAPRGPARARARDGANRPPPRRLPRQSTEARGAAATWRPSSRRRRRRPSRICPEPRNARPPRDLRATGPRWGTLRSGTRFRRTARGPRREKPAATPAPTARVWIPTPAPDLAPSCGFLRRRRSGGHPRGNPAAVCRQECRKRVRKRRAWALFARSVEPAPVPEHGAEAAESCRRWDATVRSPLMAPQRHHHQGQAPSTTDLEARAPKRSAWAVGMPLWRAAAWRFTTASFARAEAAQRLGP